MVERARVNMHDEGGGRAAERGWRRPEEPGGGQASEMDRAKSGHTNQFVIKMREQPWPNMLLFRLPIRISVMSYTRLIDTSINSARFL